MPGLKVHQITRYLGHYFLDLNLFFNTAVTNIQLTALLECVDPILKFLFTLLCSSCRQIRKLIQVTCLSLVGHWVMWDNTYDPLSALIHAIPPSKLLSQL